MRLLPAILLVASSLPAQTSKDAPVTETTQQPQTAHHAQGTFTVDVKPLTPTPADGIGRNSVNKHFHGGIEATTQGEMYYAGNPKLGTAGYVAIELVTGTLDGKHGTFVLQHMGSVDATGQHMTVQVTPGSGTGDLQGLTGTFAIIIANGQHSYDLTYTLPQ